MQALSYITKNNVYAVDMTANMGRPTNRRRTDFGKRLVAAREDAGLSQRELAEKLGISQRALSWWDRENVALKPGQMTALAEALDVTADYLLGRIPAKKRGAGPTGKAQKVFEAVSRLPRHQQKKIIDVVESFVNQHQG
jgi:transcriptional regulator with XRE-family HTH domain